MISNAPFSEVISHILHPIWPLVEWKLLIDTKVLLLRSEIHFTYHYEERATHSQVATTSIRRFPSQSKLTIDPKLLSACITLKYLSGNFLTLLIYLFGVLSGSIILNLKSSCFFTQDTLLRIISMGIPVYQYISFSENRGASFTDEVCRVLQKSTELVLAACYACLLESHDVLCSLVGVLCCLCKLCFSGHSV